MKSEFQFCLSYLYDILDIEEYHVIHRLSTNVFQVRREGWEVTTVTFFYQRTPDGNLEMLDWIVED